MVVNLAFHFTLLNINTLNKLKMGCTLISNVFYNITELPYLAFSCLSVMKITATNTHISCFYAQFLQSQLPLGQQVGSFCVSMAQSINLDYTSSPLGDLDLLLLLAISHELAGNVPK